LGQSEVDGKIVLKCVKEKWDVGMQSGLSWLRKGPEAEYRNMVKFRKFLNS
jgi:hypothetical protein